MSQNKLKIAFYWAASCGGCEIAVLDINEKILDVMKIADIVFWPVAIDVKYKDVEALPRQTHRHNILQWLNPQFSEQEHMAKVLRAKSKTLSCFRLMCSRRMRSRLSKPKRQERNFRASLHKRQIKRQPQATIPKTQTQVKEGTLKIPEFYDTVKTLRANSRCRLLSPRLPTSS